MLRHLRLSAIMENGDLLFSPGILEFQCGYFPIEQPFPFVQGIDWHRLALNNGEHSTLSAACGM
jgi:hypothetical protein